MDSLEPMTAPAGGGSTDVTAVMRMFDRIERADTLAGIEEMLSFSHDDVEVRGYATRDATAVLKDEPLRGKGEVLDFFRRATERGYAYKVRTKGFDVAESEDTVFVRGSIRVGRPDGSFAEANVRWRFHFRDGLVDEVGWEPRAGD